MKVYMIGSINQTTMVPISIKSFIKDLFHSKEKVSKEDLLKQIHQEKDVKAFLNKEDALHYANHLPTGLQLAWNDYYPIYEAEVPGNLLTSTNKYTHQYPCNSNMSDVEYDYYIVNTKNISSIEAIHFSNDVNPSIQVYKPSITDLKTLLK